MTCDCSSASLTSFLIGGLAFSLVIVAAQLLVVALLGRVFVLAGRVVVREWRKIATGVG